MAKVACFGEYTHGDRVRFIDTNKFTVVGVIIGIDDYQDRLILCIRLDSGGIYNATLLKRI